jgi:hypothetical protein
VISADARDVTAAKTSDTTSAKATHVASAKATYVASAKATYVASAKTAHMASAKTATVSAAATATATAGLGIGGNQAAGKHRGCQNHHHSSSHDILLWDGRTFRHRALSDAGMSEEVKRQRREELEMEMLVSRLY